jgi:hypothetical protein
VQFIPGALPLIALLPLMEPANTWRAYEIVDQSTSLVIPVRVAASLAEVYVKQDADRMKPLKITGMVAAAIVLVPVILAVGIFQLITGIEIFSSC